MKFSSNIEKLSTRKNDEFARGRGLSVQLYWYCRLGRLNVWRRVHEQSTLLNWLRPRDGYHVAYTFINATYYIPTLSWSSRKLAWISAFMCSCVDVDRRYTVKWTNKVEGDGVLSDRESAGKERVMLHRIYTEIWSDSQHVIIMIVGKSNHIAKVDQKLMFRKSVRVKMPLSIRR